MLDDAAKRWPDVDGRRELLLRLVRTGHQVVEAELADDLVRARRARQREAQDRMRELIDADALLADAAWL
jgi:hypothetical protein